MELKLARMILELEPVELTLVLKNLRIKDDDAYELLNELVEDAS